MTRVFRQRAIAPDAPGVEQWPHRPNIIKPFTITMVEIKVNGKRSIGIAYTFSEDLSSENTIYADHLDFAITRPFTEIELHLDKNIDWRWSTKLDGFTTKDSEFTDFYGELLYCTANDDKDFRKFEQWPEGTDFIGIKFKARLKGGGKDSHPFSLNIELKQADGKWLPITIDPDVRNPPTDPPPATPLQKIALDGSQKLKFFSNSQIK